jgi:hypothetical protein
VHTSALTGIPASMMVARRTFALKVLFFFGARRAHPAETLLEMVRPCAVPLLHKSHLVATVTDPVLEKDTCRRHDGRIW